MIKEIEELYDKTMKNRKIAEDKKEEDKKLS